MLLGFMTTNETDWMVENGYWVDNRYETPYERDQNQESDEYLNAEAKAYAEEQIIFEQDAIEARQGPEPRPYYLPDFGKTWDEEIQF
jgi:endonuclease YncB( thermonuclease family)